LFGSPSFLDCGQLRLGDEEPETDSHIFTSTRLWIKHQAHKLHTFLFTLVLLNVT